MLTDSTTVVATTIYNDGLRASSIYNHGGTFTLLFYKLWPMKYVFTYSELITKLDQFTTCLHLQNWVIGLIHCTLLVCNYLYCTV